jgi:alkanesulfonate monooxygenase SsuD/methylene tetrahydromethanopterin reductase-like flavin-dependent oxidoreductase (luciferase family)
MRFGIILNAGNIHQLIDLAEQAEAAGWDGVFYYDGISIPGMELYDPWVTLAGMACRTSSVRLGNIITPPSRRRPWKLAHETATLDQLSNGRVILPVGMGTLDDKAFSGVGEETSLRGRAELLDESLEILRLAWTGEPVSYDGNHYHLNEFTLRPPAVQRPGIPIWVVAAWPRPKSVARALSYDGIIPQMSGGDSFPGRPTPDDIRAIAELVGKRRPASAAPFEIVTDGSTTADDPAAARAAVEPFADAGATWWIEVDWEKTTLDSLRRRVAAGPPKLEG